MQQREKILAGAFGGVIAIALGLPYFESTFLQPLHDLEAQESSLVASVDRLKSDQIALAKSDRELRDWKAQSLPPETLNAERLYQEWLADLAQLAGFRNVRVEPSSAPRREARAAYTVIEMRITGDATFAQVQQFVDRFQEISLLQQIVSINATSTDNQGNPLLKVDAVVAGLSLPDAAPRNRLFPETTLAEPLDLNAGQVKVVNAAGFPKAAPFRTRIDREYVQVTSISGDTWTIERGAGETFPADHPAESPIELTPLRPDSGKEATLLTATSLFAKPSPPVVYTPTIAAAAPPVIRGVPWKWKAEVTGWSPAEPDPIFKLEEAPAGMTVDPATGELSWSPEEAVEVGPYSVKVVALSGGKERASATVPLRLRLPNNPPKIEPLSQLTFYFGRESTTRLAFSDADMPMQTLNFTLEGAPEGMNIDPRSGVIRWTPPDALEAQALSVTVKVVDSDEMPLNASITIPIKLEEDAAKYTALVGCTRFDKWKAWLSNKATNEDTYAFIGDQVKVADIEFKILDINRERIIVDRDGKPFRLEVGDMVIALAPASAAEWSPPTTPVSAPVEVQRPTTSTEAAPVQAPAEGNAPPMPPAQPNPPAQSPTTEQPAPAPADPQPAPTAP